uniref:Uncharacterized protein n=1 Tax=Salmonella sp. TaxID=599 RepID=A0A482ET77_SALSP|nr:hypothetical protein NNIBIDOC_00050 [Salmonella sp.]
MVRAANTNTTRHSLWLKVYGICLLTTVLMVGTYWNHRAQVFSETKTAGHDNDQLRNCLRFQSINQLFAPRRCEHRAFEALAAKDAM